MTMSAGGVTASSELVIEAGGYTPEFFWLEEEMYQWDLARAGQEFQAHGFSANVPIQVTLDGNLIGNFNTTSGSDVPWENGALDFVLASDVAPGEHTLLLTTAEATLSATVTVLDDAAYRTIWLDEFGMAAPYGGINRFAVTVSELAAEPVIMEGKNFPGNTMVDVYVNGVRVDTVPDGGWDEIKYPLQGLEVGPVNVQLVHPVGSVEGNFTVVPDEPDTSPAAGDYFGVSHQKISGDPIEWPLTFAVTSDGLLTGLSAQYFWQCRNMDGVVTGEAMMDFAASGFPDTRITVDRPFEISWSDGTGPFTMRGIVNSDGTASGQLTAYPFECGYFEFDWATSFDGELPGTEDPGTEDPGTEDPGTEDPGTEDPGTEDPGTEDPDSEEPGTEKPGTDKPDTEEPGEKPGTENPGTEKPSADEPEDDSDELAQTGGTSKWGYGLAALLSITAGGALLLSRGKATRRI